MIIALTIIKVILFCAFIHDLLMAHRLFNEINKKWKTSTFIQYLAWLVLAACCFLGLTI